MVNKKGFFLAVEVVKIVVALICIGFLVYFLASLYFNGLKDKDKELAGESLDFLLKEIERGAERVDIYNPEGRWILVFSGIKYEKGVEKPSSCLNLDNCVCICGRKDGVDCDDWVCRESEKEVRLFYFEDLNKRTLPDQSEKIYIENYIEIKSPPISFKVQEITYDGKNFVELSPYGDNRPVEAGEDAVNRLLNKILSVSPDNPSAYFGFEDDSFFDKRIKLEVQEDGGTEICVYEIGEEGICRISDYSLIFLSEGEVIDLGGVKQGGGSDLFGLNIYYDNGKEAVIIGKDVKLPEDLG